MIVVKVGSSWGLILDKRKILDRLGWKKENKLGFELKENRLILYKLEDQSRADKGRFVTISRLFGSLGIYKKGLFEILGWKPGTKIEYRISKQKLILRRKIIHE